MNRDRTKSPKYYDPVSADVITSAKTKPEGVSNVRWRIELRRRAKAKRSDKWAYYPPENQVGFVWK